MRCVLVLLAVSAAAAYAQQDKRTDDPAFVTALRKAVVHVRAVDRAMIEAQRLRKKNPRAISLRSLRIQQPYAIYTSGVCISADGMIVTQALHPRADLVVTITLHNGKVIKARVVGTDPLSNLALLDLPGADHDFIALSDAVAHRGETMYVAGHIPRRGAPALLTGRVALDSTSVRLRDTYGVTTTRSIHLGSAFAVVTDRQTPYSGSACVGDDGTLLGVVIGSMPYMHQAKDGRSAYVQLQFALPAARVARVVRDLQKHGKVTRAWFGILYTPAKPELRAHFKLPASACAVTRVQAEGPAYKADLRVNDVILKLDGRTYRDAAQLGEAMADKKPGTRVTFRLLRQGKQFDVVATPTTSPH